MSYSVLRTPCMSLTRVLAPRVMTSPATKVAQHKMEQKRSSNEDVGQLVLYSKKYSIGKNVRGGKKREGN